MKRRSSSAALAAATADADATWQQVQRRLKLLKHQAEAVVRESGETPAAPKESTRGT